jgi:hypothetical protein
MARVAYGDGNSNPAVRALAAPFNTGEVVRPTVTIRGYNPVSRFPETLAVDPQPVHA